MQKQDVINILETMRNSENENAVEGLIKKIESMDESLFQIEISKNGGNEQSIRTFLEQKLSENNRDNKTFSVIKKAFSELQTNLESLSECIYLSGGTVPYFLSGLDSNRFHDDIDTICSIEDISKLREFLKQTEYYKPEWDSLNKSPDGNDYGFEIEVEGVPIGIYPFIYEDGILTQRTYDPYTGECKVKDFQLQELSDYIMSYQDKNGKRYNTMSLEYIKKSKDMVGRPKDIIDSDEIDKLGLIRPEILERIVMPERTRVIPETDKEEYSGSRASKHIEFEEIYQRELKENAPTLLTSAIELSQTQVTSKDIKQISEIIRNIQVEHDNTREPSKPSKDDENIDR